MSGQRFNRQLTVRDLHKEDLGACLDLAASRGWPRERSHWTALMTMSEVLGIDHPAHSGLAATVVATSYGTSLGAIGMLLVSADLSRQGIGRHLMSLAIGHLSSRAVLLCSTAEGHSLYESIGFSDCGHTYELTTMNTTARCSWDNAVRIYDSPDWDDVIKMDQRVIGADRSRVLQYLLRHSLIRVVAEKGSGIAGFACAWADGNSVIIGPVVADRFEDACKLISSICSRVNGVVCTLNCGLDQTALRDWALGLGFEVRRSLPVMIYGNASLQDHKAHYFALASLALV
jgi:GNAT superfamily N-acetyltransferase